MEARNFTAANGMTRRGALKTHAHRTQKSVAGKVKQFFGARINCEYCETHANECIAAQRISGFARHDF